MPRLTRPTRKRTRPRLGAPRKMPAKRKQLEDAEQRALVEWAGMHRLAPAPNRQPGASILTYLFAIPNGGSRDVREAARMKAHGVKAGVHDLMLALPHDGWAGLWIEMKKRRDQFKTPGEAKRAVSDAQHEWADLMRLAGYKVVVAYGAAEAIEAIKAYLGGEAR